MPGTSFAEGLEGRLRRKSEDIYSAQTFSATLGWNPGKEERRDEGGEGTD